MFLPTYERPWYNPLIPQQPMEYDYPQLYKAEIPPILVNDDLQHQLQGITLPPPPPLWTGLCGTDTTTSKSVPYW